MTQLALFIADDLPAVRATKSRAELETELDLWTRCAFRLGDLIPGKLYDEARACFAELNAYYDAVALPSCAATDQEVDKR